MERPIYLSRARWAEWEPLFNRTIRPPARPPPRPPTNKITHCAICLELLRGKNIKIFYKRKYKSVSKSLLISSPGTLSTSPINKT